ncbi:hypothetical protein [Limosilactobacillus reuteri]|uniref:hypothetical protein n=1 Tax=Limosilactobacillus reuteri TaxID=1598 RepID=UPI001E5AE56C|nr:hypothetical protein [Limosilactobacillus reuteri]MCC4466850.1 hypothetical protein [Limosilactobacillus reuteri]MCC4472904.1 hypothetical protein [Limosilactobacillus reuteri]
MAYVFLDKIPATAHIESVTADKDLANGQWLSLGLLNSDGESRVATVAKNETEAEVFLADEPLSYGDPHFDLASYKVKAGQTGRAYHLIKGDVVSVTTDLVTGAKVGDNLTVGDNGLGFKKATEGKGIAMLIGKETKELVGGVYVIAIR